MKTVFITGSSAGIGKETVKLFQKNGWNVAATMRNPDNGADLAKLKNVKVIACDVTDIDSIRNAISEAVKAFGTIDVLVNNAGYYLIGPVEAGNHEQMKRQIDTNLLGLIDVTREVLPYMTNQKSGTIINLSSIAGKISIPLQSLYHATKWGVEGFSESLQYELRPFNIRVKLIEPGVIKTDFYGRSMTVMEDKKLKKYESYSKSVLGNLMKNGNAGSSPEGVAQTIYKAATDNKSKMRYPTGNSKQMVTVRALMPQKLFSAIIRANMEK